MFRWLETWKQMETPSNPQTLNQNRAVASGKNRLTILSHRLSQSSEAFCGIKLLVCFRTVTVLMIRRVSDVKRCLAATLEVFASGRLLFVWMTETVLRARPGCLRPGMRVGSASEGGSLRTNPFLPEPRGFFFRDFKARSSRSFSPPAGARTAGGNRHDMGAGCGRCQEAARDGAWVLGCGGGGGSAGRKRRGGATHAGETELRFNGGEAMKRRRGPTDSHPTPTHGKTERL